MSQPESALIMIVEDDPDIALLLRRIFHLGGYTTIWAHDGLHALTLLKVVSPDLITLDMNLPQLSGTEVLAQIRITPGLCELPVVIITSREKLPLPVFAQANKVIKKPFDIGALLAAIREILTAQPIQARAIGE